VVEEYGFYSIETQWMSRLKYKNPDDFNWLMFKFIFS
jgi:hypothetical protein